MGTPDVPQFRGDRACSPMACCLLWFRSMRKSLIPFLACLFVTSGCSASDPITNANANAQDGGSNGSNGSPGPSTGSGVANENENERRPAKKARGKKSDARQRSLLLPIDSGKKGAAAKRAAESTPRTATAKKRKRA